MQSGSCQANAKTRESSRGLHNKYLFSFINKYLSPTIFRMRLPRQAIEMMTKTMALELAKNNIRANLVAPGAIETDMNRDLKEDKDKLEKVRKKIPVGRLGSAEEVADVVEFLASPKASYVTGTTFFVDGGMTLYPSLRGGSGAT